MSLHDQFQPHDDVALEIRQPRNYVVILLNDDYSTWDFVVEVLMRIFRKAQADAELITSHVHRNGEGMCGVYPLEIAQTKVAQVHQLAKKRGFPLRCTMREVE
ncbi:ATP-dependent Clp protease adaptor ClpS [Chrysiogenes arsenatis]|uniref:ATP-dependent Clp protease adaptor ClpS n=1 Tax=Chrysiogenes arsenatis TaxID=309797 RepID=UPI000413EE63|nr:ATP-dependent Clp protease adaptor ClpS [Chrysiogenes arsenatis]